MIFSRCEITNGLVFSQIIFCCDDARANLLLPIYTDFIRTEQYLLSMSSSVFLDVNEVWLT